MGADIIAAPEMFLSGYPADDLVLRSVYGAYGLWRHWQRQKMVAQP